MNKIIKTIVYNPATMVFADLIDIALKPPKKIHVRVLSLTLLFYLLLIFLVYIITFKLKIF
jgi:hypothetical protein